jgi:hypothetical protein
MIAGVGILYIILRALIFAVVFFALGWGLRFMITSFFPEVLYPDTESAVESSYEQQGPRVNIVMDNTGEYAVPELYKTPGDPDELGNIEDLISGVHKSEEEAIDRREEEGYNEQRTQSVSEHETVSFNDMFDDPVGLKKPDEERKSFTPSFGDESGGLGGLPDLEAMATAFSSSGETSPSGSGGGSPFGDTSFAQSFPEEIGTRPSGYVGNKPQQLKGDFNPKELAEGIRTVLSKEK